MIGRAAFHAPWTCLSDADVAVFGAASQMLPPAGARCGRRAVFLPYTIQGAPCSVQWHTIWLFKIFTCNAQLPILIVVLWSARQSCKPFLPSAASSCSSCVGWLFREQPRNIATVKG